MRFAHTLRFLSLPMIVLATALTLGCNDTGPTAPDHGPSFVAATNSILWVDSRNVRITCNAGSPCTAGLNVNVYQPVTLSYQVAGDFLINSPVTTCPQGGTASGSCYLNVKVATTDTPGRRTGTLVITDSTLSANPSAGFETPGYPGIFVLASGPPMVTNSTIN